MKEIITYSPELQSLLDLRQKAEKENDAAAQFKLAKFYLQIKGESTNKKAFALFKKLAKQDYTPVQTDAQFMLAACYENGYGMQKNYPRAIKWYIAAVNNITYDLMHCPDPVGDTAYKALKNAAEDRDMDKTLDEILFGKITPELIDCVTESAENGDVDSQIYLMNLYNLGAGGVEEDLEKYAYWAKRAAENGNAEAMDKLGNMYYYGNGVEQDHETALYWLKKAVKQGSRSSACLLGKYYRSQKKYKESAKWYGIYAEREIKWRNKRLGWENGQILLSKL